MGGFRGEGSDVPVMVWGGAGFQHDAGIFAIDPLAGNDIVPQEVVVIVWISGDDMLPPPGARVWPP
jgi:hypothetical protein